MATAIDKIKEAEKKAADIRAEALQKSRDDMRAALEQVALEQKKKISDARQAQKAQLEEVEAQIAKAQSSLSEESLKAKEEFVKNAQPKISGAAEIIVKGILDI